jgi:cellulose synthase/poly-beta-1,6-N-acetylglucosamine synthase-like glycosyltransferase
LIEARAALELLLLTGCGALAIPSAVLLMECLLALLPERKRPALPPPPATVVLVPAHDEAAGIEGTLRSLSEAIGAGQRIVVVADNCTDDTAAIARRAGVEVVERSDPERRGKGYAIVFGLEQLAAGAPPEVVIIVDADCRVRPGGLAELAAEAKASGRPVQAEYVLAPPKTFTPRGVVSGLAVLVKNRVRPGGLRKIGLPCHLTGSGMAFPWAVIRSAPPTGSYLVEDMLIGIELALLGHPPLSTSRVAVTSELPERDQAAERQRRRWEHGHLSTLARQGPRLIVQGILRMRIGLIAMGLDLMVPPLAFLVLLLLGWSSLCGLALLIGVGPLPFALAGSSLAAVALAVGIAWLAYGRQQIPLRYLLFIPGYVLWKIPLYFAFFRRKQQRWERTER